MTKEVEVGDEFAGKVVKTTTFGALIELSKSSVGTSTKDPAWGADALTAWFALIGTALAAARSGSPARRRSPVTQEKAAT